MRSAYPTLHHLTLIVPLLLGACGTRADDPAADGAAALTAHRFWWSTTPERRAFGAVVTGQIQRAARLLPVDPQRVLTVIAILPDSAAAGSGLLPGDVIVAFRGKPVASIAELQAALVDVAPKTAVTADVMRNTTRVAVRLNF